MSVLVGSDAGNVEGGEIGDAAVSTSEEVSVEDGLDDARALSKLPAVDEGGGGGGDAAVELGAFNVSVVRSPGVTWR